MSVSYCLTCITAQNKLHGSIPKIVSENILKWYNQKVLYMDQSTQTGVCDALFLSLNPTTERNLAYLCLRGKLFVFVHACWWMGFRKKSVFYTNHEDGWDLNLLWRLSSSLCCGGHIQTLSNKEMSQADTDILSTARLVFWRPTH